MRQRPKGATVDEVASETGWQRHTLGGVFPGKSEEEAPALRKNLNPIVRSPVPPSRSKKTRGKMRLCEMPQH